MIQKEIISVTAYADYINKLGLKGKNGSVLELEASDNGIYLSGSYYDYMLSVIEDSLNNFLKDTEFPYTESSGHNMGDGGFAGAGNRTAEKGKMPDGEKPPFGGKPEGEKRAGDGRMQDEEKTGTTYQTVKDYIDALNEKEEWVKYNSDTNTASLVSIEAFAELLEKNKDKYSAYTDWDVSIIESFKADLEAVDRFENNSAVRQNMYNPMYYLCSYYEGYKSSSPAAHLRIRTGIEQGDTALTTEVNLSLALEQYKGIEDVDFETVWEQGHTTAERKGDSTDNFITWVNECLN